MIVKEFFAKLGLDIDKGSFSAGDIAIAGIKTGLVVMGGVAIAAASAVAVMVHSLIETTGQLDDTSQALSINVEGWQELVYAMGFGGATADDARTAFQILSRHLVAASDGSEESAKSFSKLGIRIKDAGGQLKNADVIFSEVAEKFKAMPNGPRKTAAAMDLFGRSGATLIPTLNEGAEGLAKLKQEARDLQLIIDEKTVKAGDSLGDNLSRLKAIALGLQGAIAGPLLSELDALVLKFIEWFKINRKLMQQRIDQVVKIISKALSATVAVLKVMYQILGAVIDHWQLLAVILSSVVLAIIVQNISALIVLVGQWLLVGSAAVTAGIKSAIAWAAAAAPIVLITALIAILILLIDEWITHTEGGLTIMGELWPRWKKFINEFINGGKETDPWWLKLLRTFIALIANSDKIFNLYVFAYKKAFEALAVAITALYKAAIEPVVSGVKSAFSLLDKYVAKPFVQGMTAGAHGVVAGFGGGSSPAASVGASPGGKGGLNQTNSLTINGAPGQSEEALAVIIDRKLKEWSDSTLESTSAAVGG